MSHLHFVTNELSAKRVRQLGENPDYIFNVGSLGLDNIRRLKLLNRRELEEKLNFCFRSKNLLSPSHPVTLDEMPSSKQMQELLNALSHLDGDTGIIFTGSNADAEGRQLNQMIKKFVETHPMLYITSHWGSYCTSVLCPRWIWWLAILQVESMKSLHLKNRQ